MNLNHKPLPFKLYCHMFGHIGGPLKMITLTSFQITLTQFNNEI